MARIPLVFGVGELNHDAMVDINTMLTELYATKTLYDGLKLKFLPVTINASDLNTYAALLVAPGTIKLNKIAFMMAAIFPVTPLDVGGQNLCITYGVNPRQHAIGYFSGAFLQSAANRVFDITPATGETADTIFSMPVQGGYVGNELYENLGIYAGLSDGAGLTSGTASITFYIWYFELALLATVGTGGDPPPAIPQTITTITASQIAGIDGSVPLYVCSHPTDPIDLPLTDTVMMGSAFTISNIGVAAVTIHSLTGPGTVLIAGVAGIYLNKNESVELLFVNLDSTVQFIVLSGTINVS